jgi:hypothetical protein
MDTATTAFLIAGIGAPPGEPASYTPPDWVFLAVASGWAFTVFLAAFLFLQLGNPHSASSVGSPRNAISRPFHYGDQTVNVHA